MSQFDFGNLSSPLTGAALIDSNLEPWRDALHTMHKGTSRPSYAQAGMIWVNSNATPWLVKMYDGSSDVTIGSVNASTHVFTPAGIVDLTAGVTGTLPVANGGLGIATGTSGGILYFSASGTLASSAQLDANAVVVGGGAGAAPVKSPMTVDSATGAAAGFRATFNNQVGTTYTLVSGDSGKTVTLNNASAITVTLPNSLAIGFTCECIQLGAGQVTFSAASGATLNNRSSQTKIAGQHGAIRLAVTANGTGTAAVYNLAGDTA